MIHQNNESPLISTHLISPNAREFLYSILFLFLVARYLVRTHLLFVSRASSELQTEFERVKSLMTPSSMIELRKLLDRYPTSEPNSFWLKNLFLVALEQLGDSLEEIWGSTSGSNMLGPAYGVKSIRFKKKDWNINLIKIIDLIPNPINRISFSRKTRHLSHTSFLLDEIDIDDSDNLDAIDKIDARDNIDRDLDTELKLLTRMNGLTVDMMPEIDRFYITLQFELAKAMSPCIIWIPNIHDLDVNESNDLSLEVEGTLVGSSRTKKDCSQFDNDRVALLLRPKPRNPLDIMEKGSWSFRDKWIIYDEEDELQENDSGFFQSGTMQY
ncbi:Protein Ycf2 [Capsicum baccatum]|uniref:Protein Ycf2 n=1 Tax=Capsicum baccatum TaxID=33114 RepID=A0A2G2VNC2_CAPBA|nr:Protein Ycf2 [Capsicum baccatum]